MRTAVDARLRDEARRFVLRFACEDCAYGRTGSCANGWPERLTRASIDGAELAFCKEFELDDTGPEEG